MSSPEGLRKGKNGGGENDRREESEEKGQGMVGSMESSSPNPFHFLLRLCRLSSCF
jgi:hypothetical protein